MRIIIRALLIAFAAAFAAYNVYMLVQRYAFGNGMPKIFGVATAVVISGSMEPEISVGDLVVVKEQKTYKEGEVITFYDSFSGAYITHRIVLAEGENYVTKGDANDSEDGSIPQSAVVGKVVSVLRGAGNAVSFFRSPAGLFTVIAVCAVIWGVADIISILLEKKGKENNNEQKKD